MTKKTLEIDLRDDDNDIWMNVVRAQRVKGSKLSKIELQRLRDGQRWNGADDWRDDRPRPEDQDPPETPEKPEE